MEFFNYPVSSGLLEKACRQRIPVNGTFELTDGCNFNCKMCYVHSCKKKAVFRPASDWLKLFDEAAENSLLYVLLTGGEPLTHPEFCEIYSGLAKKNVLTILNTNGYLIDKKTTDFLKRIPPVRINVTLYGTTNETYGELCGMKDGFSVVDRNITRLIESGFNVDLNMTFVKDNINLLHDMVAYAKERSLEIRPTTYVFTPNNGQCETRLSPEEAAENAVELFRLTHSHEQFAQLGDDYLRRLYAAGKTAAGQITRGTVCRAGKCSYWIHADGKISFCGMTSVPDAPSVFEGGFKDAWNFTINAAEKVQGYTACTSCRYRFVCRVCHAMTQSDGVTEDNITESYPCLYHRAYADSVIKKYAETIQNK